MSPTYPQPFDGQQDGHFVDITAAEKEPPIRRLSDIPRSWFRAVRKRIDSMDKIKLAYTKCAFLFAGSIVVTWVPSSANRVYGLTHASNPSFALNIAAAAVLPLQGFWNSAIFFWTSWTIVEQEFREWRNARSIHGTRTNSAASQGNMAEREHHGLGVAHLGGRKDLESRGVRSVLDDDDAEITSAERAPNLELVDDVTATTSTEVHHRDSVSDRVASSISS